MTSFGYKPADIFKGAIIFLIYAFMFILVPAICILGLAFLIGVI